jgi:periplasmic protein TonB
MISSRLITFIVLSLIFHAAVFVSFITLTPGDTDETARPLTVDVAARYGDPGKGNGNSQEPAPIKEPKPQEKADKPPEQKTVEKVTRKKPVIKTEKKEVISLDNDSVHDQTAVTSTISSTNAADTKNVSPDGNGKGGRTGDRGTGLGTKGDGQGTEIGYPNYGLNPKPIYPQIAKRHGYEGLVVLNVFVLESGNVGKVEVRKSSGYDVLDHSALDAVKKWVFIPGKKNGRPMSSWVVVPIRFDLTNG